MLEVVPLFVSDGGSVNSGTRVGFREHFQLPVDEVNDPLIGDACLRVPQRFSSPVPFQCFVGYLNEQTDVFRARMPAEVVVLRLWRSTPRSHLN